MKTIIIPHVSQVTSRHGMITMPNFLAIDAGGTSTRAVLLNSSGQCLGYGTAGGGNPVSRGFGPALDALEQATVKALGGAPKPFADVLIAMAGASLELPTDLYRDRFLTLGLTKNVMIESDLLATFYSGTFHDDGRALIAGTGAVAARITGSRLAAVADGTGWLLGDSGSGFWLGREVAQAVASALDGRGPATALTALVLSELNIPLLMDARTQGRLRAQQQLISKVYERSAIELSHFAPMVFAVADDAVAQDIVVRAARALARTLLAISEVDGQGPGGAGPQQSVSSQPASVAAQPLVFGGSVLTKAESLASAVLDFLGAESAAGGVAQDKPIGLSARVDAFAPVLVHDGVVGSAVLVLKRNGIEVDETLFNRISKSLASLR